MDLALADARRSRGLVPDLDQGGAAVARGMIPADMDHTRAEHTRLNESLVPSWHPALEARYAPLVEKLEQLLPCLEVPLHLPWIDAINALKRERGAVIMAHSYQSPEIFHGVADVTGDSLALAQAAAGLHAAHEIKRNGRPHNVVHRDVNQHNIHVG